MKDNVSAEKNTANREELYAMITAAQNGDKKAMETLTEQNMGLVRSVAQRFRDRGVEYEDLVQIGVMGMFRAIKSFDVSRYEYPGRICKPYKNPEKTGFIL